jgi:hypothetical protein
MACRYYGISRQCYYGWLRRYGALARPVLYHLQLRRPPSRPGRHRRRSDLQISVRCTLGHSGDRDSAEVVQLYAADPDAPFPARCER